MKDMVKEASRAGATYAKIQTMFVDELTYRERFDIGKESIKRPYQDEYNRLKKLELDEKAHELFISECKRQEIKPLTTVFTRAKIPFVKKLGFKDIKVASYDCASFPMIQDLKKNFEHLYVSTGGTLYDEIEKSFSILKGSDFSFLHCVVVYPTPLNKLNLLKMNYLMNFTNNVGFSDHTLVKKDGNKASKVAIMLGAQIIERHFTILSPEETKDGPISINPEMLKELVEFSKFDKDEQREIVTKEIPNFRRMLGDEKPFIAFQELRNRDYYRGRFASNINGEYVYNFEDVRL